MVVRRLPRQEDANCVYRDRYSVIWCHLLVRMNENDVVCHRIEVKIVVVQALCPSGTNVQTKMVDDCGQNEVSRRSLDSFVSVSERRQ